MAVIRIGTVTWRNAQGVELLLVHQSMSVIESAARIAFALRNDVSVRNFVPFDNVLSSFALFAAATRTDLTTSVDMEPSFLRNFCGRVVPVCTLMEKSIRRARFR